MPQPRSAASALPFVPERPTLRALRQAVQGCQGCPLYQRATEAVFGEGSAAVAALLRGAH